MISPRNLHRLPAWAAAVVLMVGCGGFSDRSSVRGSVHFDGQLVDNGGIGFIPDGEVEGDLRLRATGRIRDGRYELDDHRGPIPGKYRVQVYWNKKTGRQIPGQGGRSRDETEQVIPPKFNAESELIVEVKPGRNTFDFDLQN